MLCFTGIITVLRDIQNAARFGVLSIIALSEINRNLMIPMRVCRSTEIIRHKIIRRKMRQCIPSSTVWSRYGALSNLINRWEGLRWSPERYCTNYMALRKYQSISTFLTEYKTHLGPERSRLFTFLNDPVSSYWPPGMSKGKIGKLLKRRGTNGSVINWLPCIWGEKTKWPRARHWGAIYLMLQKVGVLGLQAARYS